MDDLGFSYADPREPAFRRRLIRLVELTTGQRRLKRLYLEQRLRPVVGESFFQAAVRHLELDVRFEVPALSAIPSTGPLVVVANHPYGVLDGIVIAWLVEQIRRDFLVMTNAVLLRAPELRPFVLSVDFSETDEALRTNLASRAAARTHLDGGGCIIVFPAGGVSTAPDRLGRQPAMDAPWQSFVSQLVQRGRATVVPIYFTGQNSRLFQIASHLSQTLRVALIFREVRKRIGTRLDVAIGAPLAFSDLRSRSDRRDLADELRSRTYALAGRTPSAPASGPRWRKTVSHAGRNSA